MNKKRTIDIAPVKPQGDIAPLVQTDMVKLYTARLQRLKALSENHSMKEYLSFVSDVVQAQLDVILDKPFVGENSQEPVIVDWVTPPFSKKELSKSDYWLEALDALLTHFEKLPQYENSSVMQTIERIRALDVQDKQAKAKQLLAGDFSEISSAMALFLWAALSLYWVQLVRQHPLESREGVGVERHHCPVCGSAPVASVIVNHSIDGLRYLHCNLCETEWHYVRALCSNCENAGKVNYWSLDDTQAQVRAESCDDCHSYLKIMYPKKGSDFMPDPVVDDLAYLALDILMEEKGYARSTVNPFLFPEE